MEIKKNDKFTVTIEDMGEDGAGIGRVDGYIWFVKDALIGDTIEASAMKMKKNYGFARLVRVITPAKGRVEAKCPVARACGGCQLQELDYKEQLKFKEKKVYNHLKRIGGMENLFLPEEAEQAAGVPDAADRVLRFVAVSPRVFHSNDRFHDDRVRHSRCLFRLFRQEQVFHAADAF